MDFTKEYIAGLLDGEGSFQINAVGAGLTIIPKITLTNSHEFVLKGLVEYIHQILGIYITFLKVKSKILYNISIQGFRNCHPFLQWIIPSLKIKTEEAKILLEFTETKSFERNKRVDLYFKLREVRIGHKGIPPKWKTREELLNAIRLGNL